ncbi:uncharacterized protein LOC128146338 [Harpia harpyja]|uniref:uncharacterized protein LOC128146338 n=1 Tax=Harpia harpyja TaxID=202280 RepID=UPI0022B0A049|nr:uncharacterized protein LOC128146338 [Harpia harpyja]
MLHLRDCISGHGQQSSLPCACGAAGAHGQLAAMVCLLCAGSSPAASPPCSCLQQRLCSPPSSSSLEGVFSPCLTRVLLGGQPWGHHTCHQPCVAGAARAHGWQLPLAMHKMSVWLSAACTKLFFSPLPPGMCVIAGRERPSCSGHPMQARPPLPHHRHLLLGSRQGIHLPDARWHLWCLTLPTPPPSLSPAPWQLVCKCCLDVSPWEGLSCRQRLQHGVTMNHRKQYSGSAAELQSHHGPAPPGPAAIVAFPHGQGRRRAGSAGWLRAQASCWRRLHAPTSLQMWSSTHHGAAVTAGCSATASACGKCRIQVTQFNCRAVAEAEAVAEAAVAVAGSP